MKASRRRGSRPRRWRDIDPTRRGIVLAWLSFTVTFALARLVTGVIKLGDGSSGNLNVGGVHLHHYVWGILLVIGTAAFGLVDRNAQARSWMGLALGVGLALIVDEAALLITLEDVYWSTQSWPSVAVAVVIVSVLGTALAITRSGSHEDDPERR
ncbi:MAG: hypothetical protein ABI746_01265 [Dermatophilaceae bacterium]